MFLFSAYDYKMLRGNSFFLSHGWMNTERNIVIQYRMAIEKYGEIRARHIWDLLYKNYKHLAYIKLKENDVLSEKEENMIKVMAEYANVDVVHIQGSTCMFEKLLNLEDDESIAVIEKGHVITLEDVKIY